MVFLKIISWTFPSDINIMGPEYRVPRLKMGPEKTLFNQRKNYSTVIKSRCVTESVNRLKFNKSPLMIRILTVS